MSGDTSSIMGFYRFLRPILFALPPETAHRISILALRTGLWRSSVEPDDPRLGVDLWNRRFSNPVGLAAGYDKDAEVWRGAMQLGFGFVETGSITPRPQPGNPKPRLFRLIKDEAIINRMGFNSAGMMAAAAKLSARDKSDGIVGVNLGKNKESASAAEDYALGAAKLGPFADYLVVNVSSPNTPGLRNLQSRESLLELSKRVHEALGSSQSLPPLLLKIAPDLSAEERADMAEIAVSGAFDGLIIGNTTTTRPAGLDAALASELGGLSGRPLFELSTNVLGHMYRLTNGRVPLIGVGGVSNGKDAYAKIRAGASLVQLYTALVYRGPGVIKAIKRELISCLQKDGFARLSEAIGADHKH